EHPARGVAMALGWRAGPGSARCRAALAIERSESGCGAVWAGVIGKKQNRLVLAFYTLPIGAALVPLSREGGTLQSLDEAPAFRPRRYGLARPFATRASRHLSPWS